MSDNHLKELDAHFQFGENWASFARLLGEDRVRSAVDCLGELIGDQLKGRSFLDIGCGSGLSSLAAARLGASQIVATDIDPMSARTTSEVLNRFRVSIPYEVRTTSVFDLDKGEIGHFDVVHSWGVLHHTGDMWGAIEQASTFVAPGGYFALAIYLKTPFCEMWKVEKKLYTTWPKIVRECIFHLYQMIFYLRLLLRGSNPWTHAAAYKKSRGMNLQHDLRDWLGGYPYESASAGEIDAFLSMRGFELRKRLNSNPSFGLLGSGCAEYVYQRVLA